MKKTQLLIIVTVLFLMVSCKNSDLKTEVKVQLSENVQKFSSYDKYFDESQGVFDDIYTQLDAALNAESEPSKEEAIKVLAKRIIGAADPVPSLAGLLNKASVTWITGEEPNTWIITINRKVDSERVTSLLEAKPSGGFFETYEAKEVFETFANLNSLLRYTSIQEELDIELDTTEFGVENPLFTLLYPNVRVDGTFYDGSVIGRAKKKDIEVLNKIFSFFAGRGELYHGIVLLWSYKPIDETEDIYELHAIRETRDGSPVLGREDIVEASVNTKSYPPTLDISFNGPGTWALKRITGENVNKSIAFVMNNAVYFSPLVFEEITSGKLSISANLEEREAEDLAILLGSGYMPPYGVKVLGTSY